MAFNRFNEDMNIISKLDDEPNDVGGLSGAALKAEFDKAGKAIQTWINNTLLAALEARTAAGNIGVADAAGLNGAATIQAALENIVSSMADMSQGSVADGSLTTAKYQDGSVTAMKLADDSVGTNKIEDDAVTEAKLADYSVDTDNIKANAVTESKIAENSVGEAQLSSESVTESKIKKGAVGASKIADGAVGTKQLANAVITAEKLAAALAIPVSNGGTGAADADTARKNLGVPYIRYGTSLPSSAQEGDIFFLRVQ